MYGFLDLTGGDPVRGRDLTPDEDGPCVLLDRRVHEIAARVVVCAANVGPQDEGLEAG